MMFYGTFFAYFENVAYRDAAWASWGEGASAPSPQGPSAPLKDAAAPNLDFFQIHMYIYYNIKTKINVT